MDTGWKYLKRHDGESLKHLEQTVSRNLQFEDTASEDTKRSEEHDIGNWKKGNLSYIVVES